MKKYALLFVLCILGGCSGGESDSSDPIVKCEPKLVSGNLASRSTASASYDDDRALIVIDNSTDVSGYWAGNIVNDYIELDLGSESAISDFSIYSTEVFLGRNIWKVEVSKDKGTWNRTVVTTASNVTDHKCNSMSLIPKENLVRCSDIRPSIRNARYVRLTLTQPDPSKLALIKIYEIKVNGRRYDTSHCDSSL